MNDSIKEIYLNITEIFYSIQGEGSYTGFPCVFVRLAECNLRCNWCDTTYSYSKGTSLSIPKIISQISKYQCDLVEITGGEPLLQNGVFELINKLNKMGKKILIETNGSLPINQIPENVHIIMDIKPPSSNGFTEQSLDNLYQLKNTDEVKIVISNYDDFNWAIKLLKEFPTENKFSISMQAAFEKLDNKDLANWILESGLKIKLGVQLHKFIFDKTLIGV